MKNLREEHPDLKPVEVIKMTASKWNTLSSEQKVPYEIVQARDRQRFEQQISELD
jgi:hypothetical protein